MKKLAKRLLKERKKASISKGITFSNLNLNLELVIINHFCRHYKSVHKFINYILLGYTNNVRIRSNINTKNMNSHTVKITSRLFEKYNERRSNNCLETMGDICKKMFPFVWLEKWSNYNNINYYVSELKKEVVSIKRMSLISFLKHHSTEDFSIKNRIKKLNNIPLKRIGTHGECLLNIHPKFN